MRRWRPFCSGPLAYTGCPAQAQTDPLPSWNDTSAKQAIVEFVTETTKEGSPTFVPPAERIATFDQDGTLWVEHPMYSQVIYCLERVPALVAEKPELKDVEPFKTVLTGDREAIAKLPMTELEKLLAATLSGMTVDEFQGRGRKVDRIGEGPALEATLYGADLPADAGGSRLPARQWLQDLHRHRRRPGLCSGLLGSHLRHPAGAGRRNRRKHHLQLRQGRQADPDQGAEAPSQRQRCRQAGGHPSDDRTPAGFRGGQFDRRSADAGVYRGR